MVLFLLSGYTIKGEGFMIAGIYHFIVDKKIPTLGACLAFTLILNGGSFLFLYILISGLFSNGFNELLLESITDGKLKDLISYFFNYQNNLSYSIFLVGTSLYSASSLYYQFISVVELITQIHYKVAFSKRILSLLATLIYLILLNVVALLSTQLILLFHNAMEILFLFILFIILSLTLYLIQCLAIRDFHFKRVYKGFLFSLIYFLFFTIGFILYLRLFSDFKIVYGILSFFIILFFYIYIVSIGVLLGVYLNYKNINLLDFVKNKKEEVKE